MQFDFISIAPSQTTEQFDLWNLEMNAKSKNKATIKYDKVEKFFHSLDAKTIQDYKNYWQSLAPKNDVERFQKWIFALMSVHSTYEANIRGYNALKNWTEWFNKWEVLENKLIESRVGLHNQRTRYLKEFSIDYWNNPSIFVKSANENWIDCRDRLMKRILGLGLAKVSFAFEMIAPLEAEVLCSDTHIYQAYGLDQTRDSSLGRNLESHWVQMSKLWNCPPAISRAIYWDKIQGKSDSSYWMGVFNTQP